MFKTSKHLATRRALLATALLAVAAPSFAQAPTDAQKSAIRSACRADYQAHCSSVTPGGAEALQCLSKNMSSLSSACQSAVRAIEPAAAPNTEPKSEAAPPKSEPAKSEPAKTEAAPPAAPAAKPAAAAAPKAAAPTQPSSAQVAAIKSACRADYPKVCASVPPGGAAALECLEKNKAKVSPACAKAMNAASGGAAAASAGAAPAAAATPAAAPTVIVLRPLRPREELLIVRSACGGDIRTLCAGVAPGGGRIAQCLASNAAGLSPACKEVLAPFAAR
ncbi:MULTISPECIES: cysteine rich repeat-containing protein [unclassified Bradyrhizobium]|uniref:cysteine rich repeat-containing protein n=1 Tax=unclassified Bradyrhizobium TaxID=2631580 RepID=UPI0024799774|nr:MULTISPECIES: cysteine rich repeat-containing protein [unclassified Bradyrhizobium]WGR71953.1 cysteine rich repeat-containing protein [Bradyrhizobium sp. ISRA426]WGR76787.1 cysteine rich repeat-containing protein [Bradyrhizobium sp. ISRA430]WGR87192.1 cysteine rich repeat-containing protein [Bradyrhizobium sp. ISRA432]